LERARAAETIGARRRGLVREQKGWPEAPTKAKAAGPSGGSRVLFLGRRCQRGRASPISDRRLGPRPARMQGCQASLGEANSAGEQDVEDGFVAINL
jgi:hypothetical protein